MRRFIVLLAVAAAACSLHAAARNQLVHVTVRQLQQFLQDQQTRRLSDRDLAAKLSAAQLSEQLTEFQLDRLKHDLSLGPESATELDILADLSAFLNPPAADAPTRQPPDSAAQKQILSAAQNFAAVTLARLPDFMATRTTRSFEDIPFTLGGKTTQSGLHPVQTSIRQVAFRDGREFAQDLPPARPVYFPASASLALAGCVRRASAGRPSITASTSVVASRSLR